MAEEHAADANDANDANDATESAETEHDKTQFKGWRPKSLRRSLKPLCWRLRVL